MSSRPADGDPALPDAALWDDGFRSSGPPGEAVRRALAWYLSWSAIALVVVGLGVILVSGAIARRESLRDAEQTARAVAHTLVGPIADRQFHARDRDALRRMTDAMAHRTADGSIKHIKVWGDAGSGQGVVLWSDEKPLVGQRFTLTPEEYALFGTTEVVSSVSDLEKDENALEQQHGQLVEVYTGLFDAAGVPILFEAYVSTDRLIADSHALTRAILPLTLGTIAVLALATLPLATSLARRVDRGQQQMRRLLMDAVATSDLERRRIAQNLHDGVIQDLAGVGYALSAETGHLPPGPTRDHLDQVNGILLRDLAALRTLMSDIHPPDLDEQGLAAALHSLVEHTDFGDAEVEVDVQPDLDATPLGARVAFRLMREVLRNTALHAHAQHVLVRVARQGEQLEFEVLDDGIGFDPALGSPDGHLGLRLIQEMAVDAGGAVRIRSTPGQGTQVLGVIPR